MYSLSGNSPNSRAGERLEIRAGQEALTLQDHCARTLDYFAGQPDFTVQHSEVGQHVRSELDMELEDWSGVVAELLKKQGILAMGKSRPDLRRPDTISLNIEAAAEKAALPYMTPSVIKIIETTIADKATLEAVALDGMQGATRGRSHKSAA